MCLLLKKFLQIYEGRYQIKKQVRPGTYILRNPESEGGRGMFHTQGLKHYHKREDSYPGVEETRTGR